MKGVVKAASVKGLKGLSLKTIREAPLAKGVVNQRERFGREILKHTPNLPPQHLKKFKGTLGAGNLLSKANKRMSSAGTAGGALLNKLKSK